MEQLCCDIKDEKCMTNVCRNCSCDLTTFIPDNVNLNQEIVWQQWEGVNGYPKIIENSGKLQDALCELARKVPQFKIHSYVRITQSEYFEHCKREISDREAVVQIDFAENYTLISQDEIQSAHWSHTQVTVFTCCIWLSSENVKSYDMSHILICKKTVTYKKYGKEFRDKFAQQIKR